MANIIINVLVRLYSVWVIMIGEKMNITIGLRDTTWFGLVGILVLFVVEVNADPVVYWKGDNIYRASNNVQAAHEVRGRGFTHAVVNMYGDGARGAFLASNGFVVLRQVGATTRDLDYTPRRYSPYNNKPNYDASKEALANFLNDHTEIAGIVDDMEDPVFPEMNFSENGEDVPHVFEDLQERIGNEMSQSTDWPVFKNWPTPGDHDVSNLTMENIEYNFPNLSIDHSYGGAPTSYSIIGYYGSGFTYQSYEMSAQTFYPSHSRITRVDVQVKRYGSSYPLGDLNYYLTRVDINGKPDLTQRISTRCWIRANEIDKTSSASNWIDVAPLTLYFDPIDVGVLNTNEQYAIVLEFTKKDSNEWNDSYYQVGGFSNNGYSGGQAWRMNNGAWTSYSNMDDFWLKVYNPSPPTGFGWNQFHEDWIDFQCSVNARFVEDYRTIADSVFPQREVWVYSGYGGATYKAKLHNYDGSTRRSYAIDWEKMSAAGLDYAMCGYGSKPIAATVNALIAGDPVDPPKLIGGGYTPHGEESFHERFETCDGAMFFYLGHQYTDDPGWGIDSGGSARLLGDANGDGVVSADDYASVQMHFGEVGTPGIPGDANHDGVVSADDYASVQANFGNSR